MSELSRVASWLNGIYQQLNITFLTTVQLSAYIYAYSQSSFKQSEIQLPLF